MDWFVRYRRDREFEIAEASERQRERMVDQLQAQAVAAERTAWSAESIAIQVSRIAATADWALPAIAEHLAATAERLGGIEQMLANPTETAAAEFYRRGSYALACGWLEEAEQDLSEAVRLYPYNPRSWFNLGVGRQRAESIEAAAAFTRCARYATPTDPRLAARAVLLGSYMYRAHGRPEESQKLLREYAAKHERCAELHLALGVHHGDVDHLVSALTIAPDLALDARVSQCQQLDEAAAAVCRSQQGPVEKLRAIETLASDLYDTAHRACPDAEFSRPDTLGVPSDGYDALLLAHAGVPAAVQTVERLALEIQQEHRTRAATAQDASVRVRTSHAAVDDIERLRHTVENSLDSLCDELCCGHTQQEVARSGELTQTARRALLDAEIARAAALADMVATMPDMYAKEWTDRDFTVHAKGLVERGHRSSWKAPDVARTWMEVADWVEAQIAAREQTRAAAVTARSCAMKIWQEAIEQTRRQVRTLESIPANDTAAVHRIMVAASDQIAALPDKPTADLQRVHNAQQAAYLAARTVFARDDAERQRIAEHDEAWGKVQEILHRVQPSADADALSDAARSRIESGQGGWYVPDTVRNHLWQILVLPVREKEATCRQDLATSTAREQQATSAGRTTAELVDRATTAVTDARRIAAPPVRIVPFDSESMHGLEAT